MLGAMSETTTGKAKRVAIRMTVGALLGLGAWSLSGPKVISWWYEPPSKDAFSCAGSVRGALSQFVYSQLIAAAVGATVVAIVVGLLRRWWDQRGAAAAPAVAPAPAAVVAPPPGGAPPPA
jgi:hypothetical protein